MLLNTNNRSHCSRLSFRINQAQNQNGTPCDKGPHHLAEVKLYLIFLRLGLERLMSLTVEVPGPKPNTKGIWNKESFILLFLCLPTWQSKVDLRCQPQAKDASFPMPYPQNCITLPRWSMAVTLALRRGRLARSQVQWWHSQILASQGYTRPCLDKTNKTKTNKAAIWLNVLRHTHL